MGEKIILDGIVSKGTIIETKHLNAYDSVSTKVTDFYEEFIEVMLVDDYLVKLVMVGDKLFCKAGLYENNIYTMDVEVYNVKISSRTLILKVNKINMLKNNRGFMRYDIYLCSDIKKKEFKVESYSVVINVSLGGLGIVTSSEFDVDNAVYMKIYLPGFEIIKAECSVRWKKCEDSCKCHYGLEINSMDYFDKIKYEDYITGIGKKLFYI